MSAQINMHREWDEDNGNRVPWRFDFRDHERFATVTVSNGRNSVAFFDDDITQFLVALEAAWLEFNNKNVSGDEGGC